MLNNIQTLRQAITLAQLDSIDTVTIDMVDLVMLERQLKEYEATIANLQYKVTNNNIQIGNLISEGLAMKMTPKLDSYA